MQASSQRPRIPLPLPRCRSGGGIAVAAPENAQDVMLEIRYRPYGIRMCGGAVSTRPYEMWMDGTTHRVFGYELLPSRQGRMGSLNAYY